MTMIPFVSSRTTFVFLWMFFLFMLAILLSDHTAAGSVWLVEYPEGGDCRNVTFSDASRRLVCITGGALYGPSPAMIGSNNEIVYLGQQGEDFAFFQGNEVDGTATAAHIATVRLGYNVPNVTDCFLTVNGEDCCSCRSCLDEEGDLVGMKGDCTNVPNGRRVRECEALHGYFPLDLTMNPAPSGDCNNNNADEEGDGVVDRNTDSEAGNTGKENGNVIGLGNTNNDDKSSIFDPADEDEEVLDTSACFGALKMSIIRTGVYSAFAIILFAYRSS
jgi:hypothetical protein